MADRQVLIHGKTYGCGFHCIKIKNISVRIGGSTILKDVSLHIHCGSLTAVIGRNGAGKSTLLRAILGELPHEGEIVFTDLKAAGLKQEQLHTVDTAAGADTAQAVRAEGNRKLTIGYVPQSLNIEKNTPTTVYDLLASYVTNIPVFLSRSRRTAERIKKHLAVFQAEELLDKAVCDLSGGELQRVLLSLATMPVPRLLILDEPASGIDRKGLDMFYKTITRIKEEYDMAVLLVSHDLEYIRKYADHVVLLDQSILAEGEPEKVYRGAAFEKVFGGESDGNNL